jgi:MYXO-CTERM domain-containing protein
VTPSLSRAWLFRHAPGSNQPEGLTGSQKGAAGFAIAAGLLEPVRSLAASTTACSNAPVLPESPAGPALLVVAALGAIGFVAYRRRRRGLAATALSTLTIVLLTGALLTTVLAAAATSACSGDPSGAGEVLAAQAGTPFTGADIPWITAGALVLLGGAMTAVARRRRRSAS